MADEVEKSGTTKSTNLNQRKKRRQEWWSKKRQLARENTNKEEKAINKKIKPKHKFQANEDLNDEEKNNLRYILFIGNLSYDCSENDLRNHFSFSDGLKDVRILTKKDSGKSKGCAFLEFETRTSQMKALKLHHSILCGRKINVELTCGGGGKGEHRMNKLKSKVDKMKERRRKAKMKKRNSDITNSS